MANGSDLESRFKTLAAGWALALGMAAFSLQAAGYLALRFRLRAFGIEADLGLLDERFLFEGAQFLLYVLTTLPLLLLLASPVVALAALARRSPGLRARIDRAARAVWEAPPTWLAVGGLLWAVLSVQLALRHVFFFQNLLLAPLPCDPWWLRAVVLDASGTFEPLFFAGLLALLAPTLLAFVRLPNGPWLAARTLLGALLLVQLLFLPVHFGVLGAAAGAPRLAGLAGEPAGSRVWQVFATDATVFLLVERPGAPVVRRLVVLPGDQLGRVEIAAHEPLLRALATGETKPCGF